MDPIHDDLDAALTGAHRHARSFLDQLDAMRAATPAVPAGPIALPAAGGGGAAALDELIARYGGQFSGSAGPRYWGFVNGGVTPAALAGDWLCAALDQNGQRNGDGCAVFIEDEAIAMLRDLFGLPARFGGVFVTGGTMANHVALATALQQLGQRRGIDVSAQGVAALGRVHILSGEPHSSIAKSAGMLGLGRDALEIVGMEPDRERVDLAAMARRLAEIPGDEPTIIVGNAGTVLTGDFDDLDGLADLAARHGAHFHVDGAFGAFAACAPQLAPLVRGMARADTIASDGHKFLNVPYDSGFVFTRALEAQIGMFQNLSSYQSPPEPDPRHYIHLSPQNSRRLRALPAWLTLRAYGADGYRRIVERCAGLAAALGARIEAEPGFRLLAPVGFTIVCFQLADESGEGMDAGANARFLELIRDDGRVYVTPGNLRGTPCVRLAMVNWRTREADIELAMAAFRECRAAALSG